MLYSRSSQESDPSVISEIIAASLLQELRTTPYSRPHPLNIKNVLRMLNIYGENNTSSSSNASDTDRLCGAIATAHLTCAPQLSVSEFTESMNDRLAKIDTTTASDADIADIETK